MTKTFKISAGIIFVFIIFLFGFVFTPIGIVTLANSVKISGEVKEIYESSSHDISFSIKGDSNFYYINRGSENGLNAVALNDSLQNKAITLFYAGNKRLLSKWALRDPNRDVRHITRIEYKGQIIYDEIGNFK